MRRAALFAAAFLVLTACVQVGLLRDVDRAALHHLTPLANSSFVNSVTPEDPFVALRPILRGDRSLAVSVAALAFAPADTFGACILVGAGALVLIDRGRRRAGLAWIAALLAGLAVEAIGKLAVDQIQYRPGSSVLGIDIHGSYPSGHTIRSVILAAMGSMLWPRARPWLIAWVVLITGLLELGALHVPSDILGGFLAGGALTAAALQVSAGWPARPRHAALQSGRNVPVQAPRTADVQGPPGPPGGRRR